MKFEAVYHICSDNYCYMNNNSELIVNLKTGYDVEEVYIHYGDPFSTGILGAQQNWAGIRLPVPFKKRLAHQLWWTTTIVPQYKRCRYFHHHRAAVQALPLLLRTGQPRGIRRRTRDMVLL